MEKENRKNIYLARQKNTSLYKIGITKKNPESRIKELQTGNANPLVLVESFETKHGYTMETALHMEFQAKRMEGEWFDLPDEDVELFIDICTKKEATMDFLKDNNHFWS